MWVVRGARLGNTTMTVLLRDSILLAPSPSFTLGRIKLILKELLLLREDKKGREEGKLILISYRFCISRTPPSATLPPSPPCCGPYIIHTVITWTVQCPPPLMRWLGLVSLRIPELAAPHAPVYGPVAAAQAAEENLDCAAGRAMKYGWTCYLFAWDSAYMDKSFCTQFKGIVHP